MLTIDRSSVLVLGLLTLIALSLQSSVWGSEEETPWAAVYALSVDDGPMIFPSMMVTQIPGGWRYAAAKSVSGAWTTLINVNVTRDPVTEQYSFSGFLEVKNLTEAKRRFDTIFEFAPCPVFKGPTNLGGVTRLQFSAGSAGGMLVVPPGEAGLAILHDGVLAGSAYTAPFFITASGAGTVTVNGNFGLPIPSLAAPPVTSTIALRQRYDISGANVARLLLTQVAVRPEQFEDVRLCSVATVDCDINGDGVVDLADLLALLASWGPCPDCTADLTGDGSVGLSDLLSLLVCWSDQQ